MHWAAENLPAVCDQPVLITEDELWALRYPETHPLYVLERGRKPLDHKSSHGTHVHSGRARQADGRPRQRAHGRRPGLARAEPANCSTSARSSSSTRRVILPQPPAKLLRLQDLGQRAQASQAHTQQPPAPG